MDGSALQRRKEKRASYVLTAKEVEERFGLDLLTAEIIRHGLVNVSSQMAKNLQTSAFSPVVRDMQDFAVGVASPYRPEQGLYLDLLASAEGCAIHFFVFQYKARNNILEFGIENLKEGDVLVYNDAYRGGSHVMDVGCAKPVLYKGEIIAFTLTDGHWVDIGGPVPGGFSPGFARDMYSEGMRISSRYLYRRGKPVKATFDLFLDNTRIPYLSIGDLQAHAATLTLGERLVLKYVEKYGVEVFRRAMAYILDYGERRMREALSNLPDGTYEGEDYIDDDGVTPEPILVRSCLTVRGDRAELDLSGSSRQSLGNASGQGCDVGSAGHIAIKSMLLPDIHTNAGLFRPIDLIIPWGSIAQALPPAPSTQGHLLPTCKLVTAVQQSLAQVLPEQAVGESYNDVPTIAWSGWDHREKPANPFVIFQVPYGPFGGTSTHDGHCYSLEIIGNCLELSCEIEEELYPFVVLRKEFVIDTAGPGKYRGGPAVRWDEMVFCDAVLSASFEQVRFPTKGTLGGQGGAPARIFQIPRERWDIREKKEGYPTQAGRTPKEHVEIISGMVNPETGEIDLQRGEFRTGKFALRPVPAWTPTVFQVAGGGGYGDPLERNPELVRRDVLDEIVSIEGARRDYGVVIDPHTLTVDGKATRELRRTLRTQEEEK